MQEVSVGHLERELKELEAKENSINKRLVTLMLDGGVANTEEKDKLAEER